MQLQPIIVRAAVVKTVFELALGKISETEEDRAGSAENQFTSRFHLSLQIVQLSFYGFDLGLDLVFGHALLRGFVHRGFEPAPLVDEGREALDFQVEFDVQVDVSFHMLERLGAHFLDSVLGEEGASVALCATEYPQLSAHKITIAMHLPI